MRLPASLTALFLAACNAASLPPDGLPANPQRPTLSSNTATTAEGSVEVEAGATWAPNDGLVVPTTLKYGSGPATEVFVGWIPLVHDEDSGVTGVGLSQLGIRHRYLEESDELPSAAVQAIVNLPTGNESLGISEIDMTLAGIVARHFDEDYALTGYGSLDFVGDPNGAGVDLGASLAVAGDFPIPSKWNGFGELAGVFVPDRDFSPVFTTVGGFYPVAPELVFDVGILIGLSNDAPDYAFIVGVTRNFGRVSRLVNTTLN